jgi:UDP-N-acetylmuramoyl-tripeptide--D-alanyl-D-alanine ligase
MPTNFATAIAILVTFAAGLFFFRKRQLRYLQFFQQEDYEAARFLSWYAEKSAYDKKGSITIIVALALFMVPVSFWLLPLVISIAAAGRLYLIAAGEEDPTKTGKIRLKMTARAKRIFDLSFGLYVAVALVAGVVCLLQKTPANVVAFWVVQLCLIQSQPFWLVLANWLLRPYEKSIQDGFAREAAALIKSYDPEIIGITGSYGKTSTKVILKEILGAVSPTFSTPGSINSYMGVTREIRERLKPEHKFAVIEMGAYYIGSIKKLCSLTPPKAGIVTAVGVMHLERFGGQEAVFRAKSELAQAIPEDGILVCNGDYEYCRKMATENKKRVTLLYGLEPDKGHLDATLFDIKIEDKGSRFKIKWQGKEYDAFVGLLGKPMLSNVLAAFTMACAQGLAPEIVIAALRNVKAESNRLEPVRVPIASLPTANGQQVKQGQILRLNDAYNSNPIGFASALDVLSEIPGGRKILVTPGMIELGEKQEEENRRLSTQAAKVCDLVLVVGETNKKAILEGLTAGGSRDEQHKSFSTMKSALGYLSNYCEDKDVVLIENDLPDLYEGVVSF